MNALTIDSAFDSLTLRQPIVGTVAFKTRSLSESVNYVSQTSGHFLKPHGSSREIEFSHWRAKLNSIDLDLVNVDCGIGFDIDRRKSDNRYHIHLPVTSRCELREGRNEILVSAGEVFALNPFNLPRKRWDGRCKQINIRVDKSGIERELTDHFGVECHEPVVFEQIVLKGEQSTALALLVISYWHILTSCRDAFRQPLANSLERGLLSSLLATLPHNYSAELQRHTASIAPHYVRRATNYIHENACCRIGPKEIVAASGVSERSLYYGFQRWRGTSVMAYLRDVRLSMGRRELMAARTNGGTVSEVAMHVGYQYSSHFSKDYRKKFGESPLATIRGR